jgi:hypothetical protein
VTTGSSEERTRGEVASKQLDEGKYVFFLWLIKVQEGFSLWKSAL